MKGHNASKSTSWTSLIFTFKLPRSLVPQVLLFPCSIVSLFPLFPCSLCSPVPLVPLLPFCPVSLVPLVSPVPLLPLLLCCPFPCFPCSSCSPCFPGCPCFPVPIVPLFPLFPCSPCSSCSSVPLFPPVLLFPLFPLFPLLTASSVNSRLITSTNGFNFRIINSLMASWGYAWPGLTISDKLEFWHVGFCWEGMGREQSRMSVVTTAVRFILNCTPWRIESLS